MSSCSGEWAGCKNFTERKTSPLGTLELVVKNKDCGATTSNVKKIYVVKKNEKPSFWENPVLFVEKFENLHISWMSENEIMISYSKARIHEFKNNWRFSENGNITHEVELVLIKK